MNAEIHVTGLHCSSCEMLVREALEEMDGVKSAKVSHESGLVEVEYDAAKVTPEAMKPVIEAQGFKVSA
jgi:copper chaperone